jgi:hypothetical protein
VPPNPRVLIPSPGLVLVRCYGPRLARRRRRRGIRP